MTRVTATQIDPSLYELSIRDNVEGADPTTQHDQSLVLTLASSDPGVV